METDARRTERQLRYWGVLVTVIGFVGLVVIIAVIINGVWSTSGVPSVAEPRAEELIPGFLPGLSPGLARRKAGRNVRGREVLLNTTRFRTPSASHWRRRRWDTAVQLVSYAPEKLENGSSVGFHAGLECFVVLPDEYEGCRTGRFWQPQAGFRKQTILKFEGGVAVLRRTGVAQVFFHLAHASVGLAWRHQLLRIGFDGKSEVVLESVGYPRPAIKGYTLSSEILPFTGYRSRILPLYKGESFMLKSTFFMDRANQEVEWSSMCYWGMQFI